MKVLAACEYSGIVRDAFIARGHEAVSCDILPTERPGPHYQGDVRDMLGQPWDMVIAFPPCTKLSKVGAAHWKTWQADGSQQDAIDFFMLFASHPCEKVAIENPAGIMSRMWRKPDQYVQPYWFGHPWMKTTGIWVKGVSKLGASNMVVPLGHWVDGGSYAYEGSGRGSEGAYYSQEGKKSVAERAKERSRTFQGVADAMAAQWG